MSNWIKVSEHDWRRASHNLAEFDVHEYIDLETGARRFLKGWRLYWWDPKNDEFVQIKEERGHKK